MSLCYPYGEAETEEHIRGKLDLKQWRGLKLLF